MLSGQNQVVVQSAAEQLFGRALAEGDEAAKEEFLAAALKRDRSRLYRVRNSAVSRLVNPLLNVCEYFQVWRIGHSTGIFCLTG